MDSFNHPIPGELNKSGSTITYDRLNKYLDFLKFKTEEHPKYKIYQIDQKTFSDQIEIVIPNSSSYSDINVYILNALNTLAKVMDQQVSYVIEEINTFDRDILKVTNPKIELVDSLPLSVASKQISELKQLVAYSACSEFDPRPYFLNAQFSLATRMVEQFQFGHTFKGSFGFTIESPALSSEKFTTQLSIDDNIHTIDVFLPYSRRVMERIVRGLMISKDASESNNPNLIVESYSRGLNSNMCSAIVNMSINKEYPLNYSIKWAKIRPPLDETIKSPGVIQLEFQSFATLEYAAEILSYKEPQEVEIQGFITQLSAKDNPLGLDTSRSIIVRWVNEDENDRVYKVYVELSSDDYLVAIDAHHFWQQVIIVGDLQRIGRDWKMVKYSKFEVIKN